MGANELAVVAAVIVAGVMRGITGFGGAMLMAPPLSLLLGPVAAVVTSLMLEAAAALVVARDAWPKLKKTTLAYLTLPACVTVPIGGHLLLSLDPNIARKAIAGVVVVFSLALMLGLRYTGSPKPATLVALGGLVGVLLGATSVGAPPVILYMLSGPDPPAVTRANLTAFVTAISVIGVIMLVAAGAVTGQLAISAAMLTIPYLAAIWLGSGLFARLSEFGARWVSLGLMLISGIIGLVA
ncbi:MAG: hypothetical protein C5B56_01155 [Proteobacteria bacterium]|nr:MAG: hypothetical protein C5B56_01155 [Pseudomonadota bacterium]